MTTVLLIVTAVCIGACMMAAYGRCRDPLHPLMYLGPMLLYIYVLRPGNVVLSGEMQRFLSEEQLLFAQSLFTASVGLFCLGVLASSGTGRRRVSFTVTPGMRPRLVGLGSVVGCLSLAAYWFAIYQSGGFYSVYSQAKGFYSAGSGWINELVNLSIPAAALLVLAWQGERKYRHYLVWAIVFASPLLLHGFLGARRGPTFLILATLLLAWYVRSQARVSLWKVITRFGILGLLILFLVAHRQEIFLGSDIDFDLQAFWNRVLPEEEITPADRSVFVYGYVNGISETETHYWGARYAATYLVRPIPRQFWPTQYSDLGLGWMVHQSDYAGISDARWREVLGWTPARGSAAGFAADWFTEFAWFGLVGCFGMGWFFGGLWSRASSGGGLWTLLYLHAAVLSVYVPTQSVSAVFYRFLIMTVPITVLWRYYLRRASWPQRTGRTRPARANPRFAMAHAIDRAAGPNISPPRPNNLQHDGTQEFRS